jgi:pyruvate formate-lyase/glycerol dehydratase family glycyl radical enzyme
MNERIRKLREQSLAAVNRLSAERALLVTEFYQQEGVDEMSIPVQRARCFEYILRHKAVCINKGELIVGERGPGPRETPTYPEICIHTEKDLDILDSREKVSFVVDTPTRMAFREKIIPFWRGKSNRERIMELLPREWKEAYSAGVFTEFQEQRAPGHTVLGDKIYHKGMLDIVEDISTTMTRLENEGAGDQLIAGGKRIADEKLSDSRMDMQLDMQLEELRAMEISARAIIMYAGRHADVLEEMAAAADPSGPEMKKKAGEHEYSLREELLELARICRKVPARKPDTFHEALQYYWFVHLGVITELNPWDSFNPGRLDQHLLPFYREGISNGSLTREKARELVQSFWIKFNNHPSPPKVGVTAQESSTYTDFSLINLGGLTEEGEDAVNELSYLILEVIREMRILQPSSMVQISRKNPDEFVLKALDIIRTGFGQPSCFNADALILEMTRQGKSLRDARRGGASGCVETGAFGTECYILTGYFNLPKILEITLNNGLDPRTGRKIGPETGDPADFRDFNGLMEAFRKQLEHFVEIKVLGSNLIEEVFAAHMPVPFLSLLIDDCIGNARDYNAGGARYNTSYIQGVGTGSLTDSLSALKYHVFDHGHKSMQEMLDLLAANFKGYEEFRYELLNHTPKYGNDNDYADDLLKEVFEYYFKAVDGRKSPRGATYRINLLPTTSHIYFGSVTGALPDGRKAGEPLSEGISPVQGADRSGPTAVLNSAAKIDHLRTGGTLLNQKFTPSFLETEEGMEKITRLIRGYFRMNGHHIQFNVVTAETLRAAQLEPEKYADLIVRVAGYSDYFKDLGRDLQDEIIRRTEHEASA